MEMNTIENNVEKRKSPRKKVLAFASIALINVFSVSAASLAWFALTSPHTDINAFSGDLNVRIDKVTAYKYVYPYYEKSTDLVNYEAVPALRGYTIEDRLLKEEQGITDAIFAPVAHISLDSPADGTYAPTPSASNGPTNVYFSGSSDFKFCLLGDATFTGTTSTPWSNLTSVSLPSATLPSTVKNVVISEGARFALFDNDTCLHSTSTDEETGQTVHHYDCKYFPATALTAKTSEGTASEDAARFRLVDDGAAIECLKSGIYDVTYAGSGLTISLSGRSDEAIIGNNILDPTLIKINWSRGGTGYGSLNAYLPTAIKEQMTMVVFDVELTYVNANPIQAGLTVKRRTTKSERSIYNFGNLYADTTHNLEGYQVVGNTVYRNPLDASDFYAFRATLARTPYASRGAMMTALYLKTDAVDADDQPIFSRFGLTPDYKASLPCRMLPKDAGGSTVIQPASDLEVGTKYHCYIGVDYDYLHVPYFLNEDRIGKTYMLDRDFGFYFYGAQLKAQKVTSPNDVHRIAVGDTLQLSSDATTTVTYESEDESIATVSDSGLVTAIAPGSVNISVKAEGYLDATFALTVSEA